MPHQWMIVHGDVGLLFVYGLIDVSIISIDAEQPERGRAPHVGALQFDQLDYYWRPKSDATKYEAHHLLVDSVIDVTFLGLNTATV